MRALCSGIDMENCAPVVVVFDVDPNGNGGDPGGGLALEKSFSPTG